MSRPRKRFVVADLGFGFAVHDTEKPQAYAFEAGKDKEHPSNNGLNSERIEIFPTFEEALRCAQDLERRAAG